MRPYRQSFVGRTSCSGSSVSTTRENTQVPQLPDRERLPAARRKSVGSRPRIEEFSSAYSFLTDTTRLIERAQIRVKPAVLKTRVLSRQTAPACAVTQIGNRHLVQKVLPQDGNLLFCGVVLALFSQAWIPQPPRFAFTPITLPSILLPETPQSRRRISG